MVSLAFSGTLTAQGRAAHLPMPSLVANPAPTDTFTWSRFERCQPTSAVWKLTLGRCRTCLSRIVSTDDTALF